MVTWDRTPPGLETAAPVSRALRWLWRDRKDAGISKIWKFRRCTGRLKATQPGVLTVSPLYIRGLMAACKGSVAGTQHCAVFAKTVLSYD
jgi:hypothetical protein